MPSFNRTGSLLVAAATMLAGCNAGMFDHLNAQLAQGRQREVADLATTTALTEVALLHIAGGLAQVAQQDMNDVAVPPLVSPTGDAGGFRYEADNQRGTLRISRMQGARPDVDLTVNYAAERGGASMAYTISRTTGRFEGYQLAFPRLTIIFTALLGGDLRPQIHENGNYLFQVGIDASATVGVNGEERTRVSDATLDLTFPIQDATAKVGSLRATNRDGVTFLADVSTQAKALTLKGAIHDRTGLLLYRVDAPDGKLQLSPAEPATEPEGAPAK